MPHTEYTLEEKIQLVLWYFQGNSINETINLFIVAYENRPSPSATTVSAIVKKFRTCGCVNSCKQCHARPDQPRVRPAVEERQNRDIDICAFVEASEPCSSTKISAELNVNARTVRRVLKRNGYHCFKVQTTQELFPEDNFRRMEFCEIMLNRQNENEHFLENIVFCDESSFSLHKKHNPSVTRYYSKKNKHLSVAVRTQRPQKLNVWTGMLGDHIIGPFFIDGNLNGRKYLQLLQNEVIPSIRRLPINFQAVWFQQDGCSSHNYRAAIDFLNQTFPDRLISTHGTINWPARSCDLSPNDFFLWGFIKEEIYRHDYERARNLAELRQKIINFCANITPEQLRSMRRNLYDRFGYCLAKEGGLFEPSIH